MVLSVVILDGRFSYGPFVVVAFVSWLGIQIFRSGFFLNRLDLVVFCFNLLVVVLHVAM